MPTRAASAYVQNCPAPGWRKTRNISMLICASIATAMPHMHSIDAEDDSGS